MSKSENMDVEVLEETTSTDSSTENNQEDTNTSSSEGEAEKKTSEFDKYPLDKHPRWAEREADWNKRFEQQAKEFEAKFEALKPRQSEEKISVQAPIPKWFGGSQEQWDDYVSWHNKGIKEAKEEALKEFTSTQSAKEKAVADANKWFEESISNIQKEAGQVIDRNALLKVVVENELIDSKGRWNYKAGWQILRGQQGDSSEKLEARRKLASDTGKDGGRIDIENKNVKTSDDFKKERPW